MPYLKNWETSVENRKGFKKSEKNMMLLSSETRSGLEITGKILFFAPRMHTVSHFVFS